MSFLPPSVQKTQNTFLINFPGAYPEKDKLRVTLEIQNLQSGISISESKVSFNRTSYLKPFVSGTSGLKNHFITFFSKVTQNWKPFTRFYKLNLQSGRDISSSFTNDPRMITATAFPFFETMETEVLSSAWRQCIHRSEGNKIKKLTRRIGTRRFINLQVSFAVAYKNQSGAVNKSRSPFGFLCNNTN